MSATVLALLDSPFELKFLLRCCRCKCFAPQELLPLSEHYAEFLQMPFDLAELKYSGAASVCVRT